MNHKSFIGLCPVIFLLILLMSCEKNNDSSSIEEVMDIDGNSYAVISMGDKYWMAENLKTTRLNDGSKISFVPGTHEWTTLSTPGYCWYDNDENYKSEYGAMYNWFTVNTCKICPEGWYVPSDEEWSELEVYLENNGYNYDGSIDVDNDRKTNNKIGKAMASAKGWKFSENEGAISNTDYPEFQNLTGFTALPGGYRDSNGAFWCLTTVGSYWSTTEYTSESAWYRRFVNTSVKVLRDDHGKKDGFSIRCVKYKDSDSILK